MEHYDTRLYVGEVDSLEKFISYLEQLRNNSLEILNTNSEYYFRGERDLYQNIISSGLRNEKFNLPKIIAEYKREVENSLTDKELSMLLAHAQHHGLPTNLIDITDNPLVALYFACQQSKGEFGAVHLFRKTDFIDITSNHFVSLSSPFTSYFFDIVDRKAVLSDKFYEFADILKNKRDYIERVDESIVATLKNIQRQDRLYQNSWNYEVVAFMNGIKEMLFEKGVLPVSEDSATDDIVRKYNMAVLDFFPEFRERHLKETIYVTNSYFGEEYLLCMLLSLFNQIDDEGTVKKHSPLFTKFIYKPNMPFKRGINQAGSFIFQPYEQALYDLIETDEKSFAFKKSYFKIASEFKVLIPKSSAEKILKQLDQLGINQKTIFGDYDNISRYIVSKQQ